MKCQHCENEILEGMVFCTVCGTKIQQAEINTAQPQAERGEYRVVFERLKRFGAAVSTFVVKVDGIERCRLNNGETKEIRLVKGYHQVEISIFLCKPTKLTINVNGDRHLKCFYGTGKAMVLNPMLAQAIIVEDENGVRL